MRYLLAVFSLLILITETRSQNIDSSSVGKVYSLGEVLISEKTNRSSVTSAEMRKFNSSDAGSSVRILPSIILSSFSSRNESTVFLHGFDTRSVPVFIDGIPVYVPYDGYVDISRFITYDISRIDVSKGFSPVSYGANAIGGVINLISMKPAHRFELNAMAGSMSGKSRKTAVNIGYNPGKFYLQSGFSSIKRSFFPLSSSFDTVSSERDHKRDNSASEDIKFSFKTGYTPNSRDEYSLNYIFSHGSKGNPVYLGNDKNTKVRYWKWPYWDKQSLYYISRTSIGDRSSLKIRAYLDQFRNKVSSFDDNTYSTQKGKSSFNSSYDDNTLGANAELSTDMFKNNHLVLSMHIKNDNHNDFNNDDPSGKFSDYTFTAGIDDVHKANDKLRLISGISYNMRMGTQAKSYDTGTNDFLSYPGDQNSSVNAQTAAEYSMSRSATITFSAAFKNRFATMKDRYSYRLGRGIPNPSLKPENSLNLSLSSAISPVENLTLQTEIYVCRLFNTIQLVDNVQDDLSQMRNTGNSLFSGFDLSVDYEPFAFLNLYAAYSYIRRRNMTNPEILFTNVPENKIFLSAELNPAKKLTIDLCSEHNGGSFSTTDGSRYAHAFFILNASITFRFTDSFSLNSGINNLLDRNYLYEEGYPEPGRNFFISAFLDIKR